MHEWPQPNHELSPKPEIEESEVIEALRANPDLGTCHQYLHWRTQEEERIYRQGSAYEENCDFILRDVALRAKVGLHGAGKFALEEALETAELMGDAKRVKKIQEMLQSIFGE